MQDMMYCLNPSVLERQKAHLQETNNFSIENFFSFQGDHQGFGDGWPSLTSPPQHAPNNRVEELVTPASTTTTTTTISNSTSSIKVGKEKGATSNSKKRKANKPPMVASDGEDKRMKGGQGNKSSTENTSTDKKPDYIHVRARRGQATDSHSLAERVRRERISERMKYLQGLVPGCSKITGKAGMLDEIINYVQSLQRQVEFLSMKLSAVNPRPDFNFEAFFSKEMNLPCNPTMSAIGMSLEMMDPSFLQFTSLQQAAAACGLDMAVAPASVTGPSADSCFNIQRTNASWENELNSLYGAAFSFHSLQGNLLPNNMKTEM